MDSMLRPQTGGKWGETRAVQQGQTQGRIKKGGGVLGVRTPPFL